jgi:hypothetical protein
MTWITLIVSIFYPQYIGTIFTVSWATFSVSAVIFSLSGVVLPARKHLWRLSPVKNWKLAGIPVISVVSIISLIYFMFGTWVYTFTPATGFGLPHTIIIIVISAIPFLLYWIIRAYRKSQGIDIDMIFREVPPE